jgi:hypothetical protein
MAPKTKVICAVVLMGVGLVPFLYSEASFWIWQSQLPTRNNVGFTDAMALVALRVVALLLSVAISGIGVVWSLYLGRKYPTVLTSLRRFGISVTAIILGIPLIWYMGSLVKA